MKYALPFGTFLALGAALAATVGQPTPRLVFPPVVTPNDETSDAYALLGLTAIVGALGAALTFAVLRFVAAARDTRRNARATAGRDRAAVGGAAGGGRRS